MEGAAEKTGQEVGNEEVIAAGEDIVERSPSSSGQQCHVAQAAAAGARGSLGVFVVRKNGMIFYWTAKCNKQTL